MPRSRSFASSTIPPEPNKRTDYLSPELAALERWWCIHPKNGRFRLPGILPFMRHAAVEIEAIAGAQRVFLSGNNDFQLSANDVKEFFSMVRVGLTTAGTGSDAE